MRPSDWSVLGRSGDPTPGDPVAVRAGGTRYVGIADAIGRAAATMRSLEAGVSNVDSVKALLESRDKVVDSIGTAEGRYRAAGSALTAYATVLDRVQADTLQALHAARAAAGDGADAAGDQASYHKKIAEAKDAGDAEEQARWEKKEDAAKSAAAHAAGAVTAQKHVVEQAVADRDRAARTAIEAITSSTSNDGLNDSWWDDWGAKLTEWIAKIAEAVATIAGILALVFCWVPILGEVLMVIAAVAGIVAALANIILAATGEKSWAAAIESVVFAILGCIGVGGALRALGGAAKAGTALGAVTAQAGERAMLGVAASRVSRTLENSLEPTRYFLDVAKAYGTNLRGSGEAIQVIADSTLPIGQLGVTRLAEGGRVIRISTELAGDSAGAANTIAHELHHARTLLRNGTFDGEIHGTAGSVADGTPYGAGNALQEWIEGFR